MKVNPTIHNAIAKHVLENNEEREPSGRLSASRLGWPLQHQMLHFYKVPQAPKDEYTLRKFARGKDVEDRVVQFLGLPATQTQVACSYRQIVGIADIIMDYPIEIKSTTNFAFKHRMKEGPSLSHRLQGMFYAKALGYTTFGIAYVASDDYRVLCFEEEVTDEVDQIIDAYEAQVASGVVPVFKAIEAWQAKEEYNSYFEWSKLTEDEIADKLKDLGIIVPIGLPLTN